MRITHLITTQATTAVLVDQRTTRETVVDHGPATRARTPDRSRAELHGRKARAGRLPVTRH